jgi:hypothetical protein
MRKSKPVRQLVVVNDDVDAVLILLVAMDDLGRFGML